LENFAWGVFELRVRAKPHNKTNDLILKIKGVMVSLARNIVVNTYKRFRSLIEAVVAADGSLIDYSNSQYVPLPTCFYFNEIGWCLAVLCHLKKKLN
jgi:hypothetical protein